MTVINVYPIPALKDNYIWILTDERKNALVIDPGDASPVIYYLKEQGLNLRGILLTHHHWDHSNGVATLAQQFNVPVIASEQSPIPDVTERVSDQSTFTLPHFPLTFKVLAIPGHTLDHIAFYAQDLLFCGDTLFGAGCGRAFEGTPEQLFNSLQTFMALPDKTAIYCAHEYTLNNLAFAKTVEPGNAAILKRIERVKTLLDTDLPSLPSTLKEEKETNPFLRCDSPEIIANVEQHAGLSLKSPVEVFTELRKWKNTF